MPINEFECRICGGKAGSSSATETLCMSCRDDLANPDRPWCVKCGKHRCTAMQSTFDAGERRCRTCYQIDWEGEQQNDYAPVLQLVKDFTGYDGYVEQTGGNCMVAKVYLPANSEHGWCTICSAPITAGDGGWVHTETQLAACAEGQGAYLDEGTPIVATPQEGYPQIAFTWDTDNTWTVMIQEHWEDEEGFQGIDTEDLPSGADEDGNPIYGGDYATAEDVAARIVLLIENWEYGRDAEFGPRATHGADFDFEVYVTEDDLAELSASVTSVPVGATGAGTVIAGTSSDLFGGKPEGGWHVSSYGPRAALGGGWFRLSISVRTRIDWTLPTIDEVLAYVITTSPILTVVRKATS